MFCRKKKYVHVVFRKSKFHRPWGWDIFIYSKAKKMCVSDHLGLQNRVGIGRDCFFLSSKTSKKIVHFRTGLVFKTS